MAALLPECFWSMAAGVAKLLLCWHGQAGVVLVDGCCCGAGGWLFPGLCSVAGVFKSLCGVAVGDIFE